MKRTTGFLIAIALFISGSQVSGQKYLTKNGSISFFSETPIENIEAHNRQVNSALDAATGEFVFMVLMKSFEFEKALMQEHFNENYVESHKYPNATFKGKVTNISDIDFTKDGEYNAVVEGDLTIHGVTNKITEKGLITVGGDKVNGKAVFNIAVADYDIKIPAAVANKIAKTIEIRVDVDMTEVK